MSYYSIFSQELNFHLICNYIILYYLGRYFKFQTLSKYLLRFRESIRLPFNSSATCLATFFRSNSIQPSVKCFAGLFFRFAGNKNYIIYNNQKYISTYIQIIYYDQMLVAEILDQSRRIHPIIHVVWSHSYISVSTTSRRYLFYVFSRSSRKTTTPYHNHSLLMAILQ